MKCDGRRRMQTTSTSEESLEKTDSESPPLQEVSVQSTMLSRDPQCSSSLEPTSFQSHLVSSFAQSSKVSIAPTFHPTAQRRVPSNQHDQQSYQTLSSSGPGCHILPALSLEYGKVPPLQMTISDSSSLTQHILSNQSCKGSKTKLSTPPYYASNVQAYAYDQELESEQLPSNQGKNIFLFVN